MLYQRNTFQLLQPSQISYINWYLEQFCMEIHVNICTSQSNESFKNKNKKKTLIPTNQRPHTHVLDLTATGIGTKIQKFTEIDLKIFILHYFLNVRDS